MKKSFILVVILALLTFALCSCTSSSSSYKKNSYDSYDRHYSNDEITDFVNNYSNKW